MELFLALNRSAAGVEKLVVIKRLSSAVAQDKRFVEQLLEEARIAGQLAHVNIAQVFDVGEEDGSYFFAMEHVHGKSVRSMIHALGERGVLLPVEHAIHIGIQLCSALSHAHEQQDMRDPTMPIVHGALSPDNVLVTFAGDVKVTDFGLLGSHKDSGQGANGMTAFPPIAFPAPEQARGERPDPRTDVYSVGMLLLELTTGKAPLYRPPEFAPGYPPKLAAILLQAAARRRTHRHQSATELLAQLETFAQRSGVRASAASFSRFLRELFPDAEARLLRERREARFAGMATEDIPRDEAVTIPDDQLSEETLTRQWVAPPSPRPATITLDPEPDDEPELEPDFDREPGPATTNPPPAVRTWNPPVDRGRYGLAILALVGGVAIGLASTLLERPPPVTASAPAMPDAPAPSARGSLEIQTEPAGASVFLEGDLASETAPTTLRGLPLGRPIRLHIVHGGFDPYDADVTLNVDKPKDRIVVHLQPATVTLQLTIDAPDPAVWVDGRFTSTRTVPGLAVDQDHRIAVSAPGRIGKILIFRSEQGGEKKVDIKLEPVKTVH